MTIPRRLAAPPLLLCAALLGLATAAPAQASPAAALQTLVAGFYTPYINTPTGQNPPDAAAVIAAHATPALRRLLQADKTCQIRAQGECNLDFDVIVSGQDWTITTPPQLLVAQASATRITIASRFTNDGTPTEVDYLFTKTAGKWLIDDISSPAPAAESWRLTAILAHEPD